MKVIRKVVIDIETLRVLEEESEEYSGPVALAKGGGGGGGASGQVRYPPYIENVHYWWLNNAGVDVPDASITDHLNYAWGHSPFSLFTLTSPVPWLTDMLSKVDDFGDYLDSIDLFDAYASYFNQLDAMLQITIDEADAYNSSHITAAANAFAADQQAIYTSTILPKFEAGMQDINAVQSSSFVIGRALILEQIARETTKFETSLRAEARIKASMQNALIFAENRRAEAQLKVDERTKVATMILQGLLHKMELRRAYTALEVEARRIFYASISAYDMDRLSIEERAARWPLELWTYAGNLLAGPAGGVVPNEARAPSSVSTAIGGALSGAAMGAAIGNAVPGVGTAIGAGIGGVVGLLGGLLA